MLVKAESGVLDDKLAEVVAKIAIAGDLVIFPTDTIYGIGTSAYSEAGIMRLFSIKKRPVNQPVGMFVNGYDMLSTITTLPDNVQAFLFSVWPGAVTCILPRKQNIQIFTTPTKTQLGSVGVRMPVNPIINKLVSVMKVPLLETSINVSTQPFLKRQELLVGYERFAQIMIDDGDETDDAPSTIIDLTKKKAALIRNGSYSWKELKEKLSQSGIEWDEDKTIPA
jgi:L-threonylcarbamoyladenylate synthase